MASTGRCWPPERPDTDRPADRVIEIVNPWGRVQAHLLCGLASALRWQSVILPRTESSIRIHVFGFASDLERTEILYTSVLVQMWQGPGRGAGARPGAQRAGVAAKLAAGVRYRGGAAGPCRRTARAVEEAASPAAGSGPRAELVLADRQQIIERNLGRALTP